MGATLFFAGVILAITMAIIIATSYFKHAIQEKYNIEKVKKISVTCFSILFCIVVVGFRLFPLKDFIQFNYIIIIFGIIIFILFLLAFIFLYSYMYLYTKKIEKDN